MMFTRPCASMCKQHARSAVRAFRAAGATDASTFVNLDRYPLHDLASPAGQKFVQSCRSELDSVGMLCLRGFLTPHAVKSFVAEEARGHDSQQTSHVKYEHTTEFNTDLKPGEVAQHLEETEQWVMGYDQLQGDSGLKTLYHWNPVKEFVSGVLGHTVSLSVDPMNRLHLNRYLPGDAIGWHHDKSEFFFNLVLQVPTSGGQFEFVWDSLSRPSLVEKVVEGSDLTEVQAPRFEAGDVVIFRGRENLHRVTPVLGEQSRITSIFNFASEEGGGMLDDATRDLFFGSREVENLNA